MFGWLTQKICKLITITFTIVIRIVVLTVTIITSTYLWAKIDKASLSGRSSTCRLQNEVVRKKFINPGISIWRLIGISSCLKRTAPVQLFLHLYIIIFSSSSTIIIVTVTVTNRALFQYEDRFSRSGFPMLKIRPSWEAVLSRTPGCLRSIIPAKTWDSFSVTSSNGPVTSQLTGPIKWPNYPLEFIRIYVHMNTHNTKYMT